MKTYKRYVVNQTFPEGSIYECYLINEAMLYAMNYMPDGTKKAISKEGWSGWTRKVKLPILSIKMGRPTFLKMCNISKHANGY